MTKEELLKRLGEIPEEEPDEWDLQMLAEIDADEDTSTIPLESVKRKRNHARAWEREKEIHKRLVVKVDKGDAEAFKDKLTQSGETVQGHIRQYINAYIAQHK